MPVNDEQKEKAKRAIEEFSEAFSNPIVTTIEEAKHLTVVETYITITMFEIQHKDTVQLDRNLRRSES